VGYAISMRVGTPLALAALEAAIHSRQPARGCIHHTDRGSQYASDEYRKLLKAAGFRGSMSSAGNPYHNAQAESFMKTIKVEQVYLAPEFDTNLHKLLICIEASLPAATTTRTVGFLRSVS
jgi:putative transposase